MCIKFSAFITEEKKLDKSLILLFQQYKSYCNITEFADEKLKENFIEDIKERLDNIDLNARIEDEN